jgi:hypothetical protein
MSNTNTGGPAFPAGERFEGVDGWHTEPGMTLRDYFAAKAIVQCIEVRSTHTRAGEEAYSLARAAEEAYAVADAMLRAREEKL